MPMLRSRRTEHATPGYLEDDAPAPATARLQLSALQALFRQTVAVRLVLVVIGIANLVQLRHHTPPITLTGTDLAFLIAGGLISAVLGALRGFTVRWSGYEHWRGAPVAVLEGE